MSKVLVTGGAGFIGSYICEGLLSKGYQVRILDNLDPQVHPQGKPNYPFLEKTEFLHADIRERSTWDKALQGVDYIIHDAAAVGVGQSQYQISQYCDVNCMGTAHMLDYLANNTHQVKKILVAASMSSYGEGRYLNGQSEVVRPPLRTQHEVSQFGWEPRCPDTQSALVPQPTRETDERMPNSIYAINKMTQEDLVHCFGFAYGIPTTSLRYFNVYGPRQSLSNPYTGVLAIFTSRLKNNHAPVIYEDGRQTRDFIHVRDVARANIMSLESDKANGQAFNIGSGSARSIESIALNIAHLLKKDIQPDITQKFRKGDVRHCFADVSKIKASLGFTAAIEFEAGIEELSQWSESVHAQDNFGKAEKELASRGLV